MIRDRRHSTSPSPTRAIEPTPIWISHRWQVALIIVALVLLVLSVWHVPQILSVIVGAGVLALLLSFPVEWFSRVMPRGLAVLVTLLLLLAILVLGVVFLVPLLVRQLTQALDAWPDVQASLNGFVTNAFQALQLRGLVPPGETNPAERLQLEVGNWGEQIATNALSGIVNLVSGTLGSLVLFIAVLTIAIYLLLDIRAIHDGFVGLASEPFRDDAEALWQDFGTSISRYLGGVVVVSTITGILSGLTLWLIGVPYALLLGLWVAFTSFIPIFGTYIGVVPALPLAFAISPTTGILTIVSYVLIQQVQDNILTPRVQGDTAKVSPVIILLVVLWTGWAFGVFWSVLAVPALVVARVLYDFFRVRLHVRPDPPGIPSADRPSP